MAVIDGQEVIGKFKDPNRIKLKISGLKYPYWNTEFDEIIHHSELGKCWTAEQLEKVTGGEYITPPQKDFIITFGTHPDATVRVPVIENNSEFFIGEKAYKVSCPVPVEQLYDALAVIGVSIAVGIPIEKTLESFNASLADLKTDYLDMNLIHWPKAHQNDEKQTELMIETWLTMEELYKNGKIKAIGLSNFLPHHIRPLLKIATVKPMIDQLELHVGYMQEYALDFLRKENIVAQAWSPLGRKRVLDDKRVTSLAKKYKRSPAQILLNYLLSRDICVIPKASAIERMKENLEVFDFALSEDEISYLSCIPETGWSGEHPDLMNL